MVSDTLLEDLNSAPLEMPTVRARKRSISPSKIEHYPIASYVEHGQHLSRHSSPPSTSIFACCVGPAVLCPYLFETRYTI
jgi:hypothetical protein